MRLRFVSEALQYKGMKSRIQSHKFTVYGKLNCQWTDENKQRQTPFQQKYVVILSLYGRTETHFQ